MPVTEGLEPLEDLDLVAAGYARAWCDADGPARDHLRAAFIGAALPMARRLARRFGGRGEPAEDLEQVARLGLVKAVNRYDPDSGSFTAFAIITITGELKRHFRNHAWGVHVPRRMQELSLEVGHARATLTAEQSHRPTDEEIAGQLDIDVADVRAAHLSAASYAPGSLNAQADGYDDAEIGDLLGADDPDLALVEERVSVERLLGRLPERERRILALRFYGNLSQVEIAARLGVSQMHVSRLLARTLAWLRQAMLSDSAPAWPGYDDTDHRITLLTSHHGDDIRIGVSGEIDRDNAEYLRDQLLAALGLASPAHRMVLDLAGVPLLDAAGIAALLALHEAARVRGIDLRVCGLQPYVARIAAITGLADMIDEGGHGERAARTPS